jgi:hypothetical protein
MRKGLMIGLLAVTVLGVAATADAGLPCAAYSSTVMAFQRKTGTGFPCNETNLVWCPQGDYEKLLIRVTVRDCLSAPVATCDVRLDLSGQFDPTDDLGAATGINGRICGTASRTATTDANGAAVFEVVGGGGGKYALHWVVTALCADPDIELTAQDDTLCIKSLDFNGTGNINFLDTFKYAPFLSAGSGYSGDFQSCSDGNLVNFLDTFQYAPHLQGGHLCASSFTLTRITTMGSDCNLLF